MTVSSSTNRVSYSGNGTLTTFAYTFKVFDQGDLTVILRSSTGTETVQTITTHYTVTGVGDVGGGNVVFVTAPSATETVVILREQDLTQGLDLVPNDPFPAQSLEESLDKLTFMVQQHEEELGRAIKASRTNTLTGSEFTISAADRANKVFAFDSSGDLSVTQELGTFKGNWAASTAYVERDLVKDTTTNDVFIVNSAHTSSGSLPLTTNTNSAKYDKIIDISNPPGDLTVGGNISTSGSVTAGSFVIGSADINENDLEAIDSVTAGTVAASKAVVVDVNKDISSFRNLTATGDITFGGLSDGTITVTAFVDEDNMASDSATLVPTQQSVKAYVDAQVATADALSEVLGNGNTTGGTDISVSSGDDITFADSSKAIFGAGSDLQIYHDGSNSYIDDAGTGSLRIRAQDLLLADAAGNPFIAMLDLGTGGSVSLRHNTVEKLATTSTGIDVTGTVTADGLTVEDADGATIRIQSSDTSVDGGSLGQLEFYSNDASTGGTGVKGKIQVTDTSSFGTAYEMNFFTGYVTGGAHAETKKMSIGPFGDISFYEDTGTTAKFFWDASAESLGIGTSSPVSDLDIQTGGASTAGSIAIGRTARDGVFFTAGTVNSFLDGTVAGDVGILARNSNNLRIGTDSSSYVAVNTANTERMRIDSNGHLLVGTTNTAPATNNVAGISLRSTGHVNFSRDGGTVAYLNRKTSDGDIIDFRKDGTTVGSIGVQSTDQIYIGTPDGSGVGIVFDGDNRKIDPTNGAGSNLDNAVDLGNGSHRFKDLYLSGDIISDEAFIGGPSDIGYKFHLLGDAAFERTGTTSQTMVVFRNGNGNVGTISTSGTSTAYNTSSDYRLKENVVNLTGATDRIKQIPVHRFNFIADPDTTVDGFLAHEVQSIVPEAVTGAKDAMRDEEYEVTPAVLDDDGNVITEAVMGTRSVPDYQGIDQSKLVPLLVATIKELEARITALENA